MVAARDLAAERGLSAEVAAALRIHANGAGWIWQTQTTSGATVERWKSYVSVRPEGDKDWAKYRWLPKMPPDGDFFYPPGRSLAEAIARGGGRLYLVGGEIAAASMWSADIWNATCTFGDSAIPLKLPELLLALGVKTLILIPDRDESGATWGGHIRDRLMAHPEIELEALALPYDLAPKHGLDVNNLWLDILDTCPPDELPADRFAARLAALPPFDLPAPERKSNPESSIWALNDLELPRDFLDDIERALGITRGYKLNGWSKKPVTCPFHADDHPSAGWNKELGILHCFSTCGKTFRAKDVGEALGLRPLREYMPTAAAVPLASPVNAPERHVQKLHDAPAPKAVLPGAGPLKRGLRPPLPAGMLTEADLALAASGRGFLDDYVAFASAAAPAAPAIFHEALGLWLLSAISTRRVALNAAHAPLFPNLYILIVARTTLYRKSTAMDQTERLIEAAGLDYLLLPSEFSTEALFDMLAGLRHSNEAELPRDVQLREQKGRFFAAQRSFLVDEASSIFALAKRDYGSGLHELLLKGFDAPQSWSKSLKTRGLIVVRRPCLSFMGATTPLKFGEYFGNAEAESGLSARFVFVTPDGPPIPPEWPPEIPVPDDLITRLRELHWILPFRHTERMTEADILAADPLQIEAPPVLPARFAPEARARMDRYARTVGFDLALNENDQAGAVYGRLVVTAKKIALLLAYGQMTEKAPELVISEANAVAAILICEQWRESYHRLSGDVARASSSKLDEKVLRYLAEAGPDGKSARDIFRECGMRDRRQLEDMLLLLTEDGKIERFPRAPQGRGSRATNCYRLAERGEAQP
jgi:hypothetical protein